MEHKARRIDRGMILLSLAELCHVAVIPIGDGYEAHHLPCTSRTQRALGGTDCYWIGDLHRGKGIGTRLANFLPPCETLHSKWHRPFGILYPVVNKKQEVSHEDDANNCRDVAGC